MQLKRLDEAKYMCWESLGEGVEICHDDSYKSSQYWNPNVIFIDTLMTMKQLGLP